MVADTREINRQRLNDLEERADVWLFGYGSLIYKVDFPYLESQPAQIAGWSRRFWQGSHDHRGTPEAPGRVVTLVPEPGALCIGRAFRVAPGVFGHLDEREKNGYVRDWVDMHWLTREGSVTGLVYRATADNAAWLGPAADPPAHDARAIAHQVAEAQGPSGSNREYVERLHTALRDLGTEDPHVAAIVAELQCMGESAAGGVKRS